MRTDQTTPETHVTYRIAVAEGNTRLSPSDWSGYDQRLHLWYEKKLPVDAPIYGLDEARAHVTEVRNTEGESKQYWASVKLTIQRVTTVTENIETFNGNEDDHEVANSTQST